MPYKDLEKRKEYHKKYNKEHYKKNKEKVKERQKKYSQSEQGKDAFRKATKKYKKNNPEKYKAHYMLRSAIRGGKLQRSVYCQVCGIKCKTEAHHNDYNKPLKVEWLCLMCHKLVHSYIAILTLFNKGD